LRKVKKSMMIIVKDDTTWFGDGWVAIEVVTGERIIKGPTWESIAHHYA